MNKPRIEKKSPLKVGPLPVPGQSLQDKMDDVLHNKILYWALMGGLMFVLAAAEWLRWLFNSPPSPIFMTVLAACVSALAIWKIKKHMPLFRQLQLGYRGELVVGQSLEQFCAEGYQVFHDIPGDGYNIDHAIIGPGGVFAIETKTISKPSKGMSEVVYDGARVTVDGAIPDRDPIVQVSAAASELARLVKETTGRELVVRPVLLYPGWYTRKPKDSRVWVLNHNAFPKFLEHEPRRLGDEDINVISAGIRMYLRNQLK